MLEIARPYRANILNSDVIYNLIRYILNCYSINVLQMQCASLLCLCFFPPIRQNQELKIKHALKTLEIQELRSHRGFFIYLFLLFLFNIPFSLEIQMLACFIKSPLSWEQKQSTCTHGAKCQPASPGYMTHVVLGKLKQKSL